MHYIDNLLFGTEANENLNDGPRLESKRVVDQPERWTIELVKGDGNFFREPHSNHIKIKKQTFFSFLPKILLRNLLKPGNLFMFTVLLIMLIKPSLSPYYRWIVIFPLGIYILVNAGKELFLDYIRQREYDYVNRLPTKKGAKQKGGLIEEGVQWKDLEVGSIIQLKRDEICPADIVVLDTNLTKNRENVCYVDTQLVNGQTVYDRKRATNLTRLEKNSDVKDKFIEYRKRLNGKLEYSAPTRALDEFDGYLKLKKDPKPEHLSIENLILRGSVLRNTDWVYGIVVYAGHNTKYMLNANYGCVKYSYFERHTNFYLGCTISFVLLIAAISVIVYRALSSQLEMILELNNITNGVEFFSYIILYSPFVPISLYGTLDLISLLQRYRLQRKFAKAAEKNLHMKLQVLNPDVLPNLGQVSYCLIDKTGTLTTGDFRVRRIITTVKNYNFEEDITAKLLLSAKSRNEIGAKNVDPKPHQLTEQDEEYVKKYGHRGNSLDASVDINFAVNEEGEHYFVNTDLGNLKFKEELENKYVDSDMLGNQNTHEIQMTQGNEAVPLLKAKADNNRHPSEKITNVIPNKSAQNQAPVQPNNNPQVANGEREQKTINGNLFARRYDTEDLVADLSNSEQTLKDLSEGLVLCHSSRTRYDNVSSKYSFESVNPEEVTLLKLARSMGYEFEYSNRADNPSLYHVKVHGKKVVYNILGVNEFSYNRRRQSICIREPLKTNSDPAILYVKGSDTSMKNRIKFTQSELDVYNSIVEDNNAKGFKTLVLARRLLTPDEANDFYKKYQNYKGSLYSQEQGLEKLADEIEDKLELLGVIGLQDEPRPGAKQFLDDLRSSDINCWMVTGDSIEQAVSTGYLFGFLDEKHETYYINPGDQADVRAQVRNILAQIKRTFDEREGKTAVNSSGKTLKSLKTSMANKRSIGGKDRESFKGTVVLAGEAWKVILADQYLLSNFAFIASIFGTIVAHSMTPIQKKKLVLMIKNRLVKPQSVMSIGDGLNDALMLQAADIGVEISSFSVKHPINAGDIKVLDFAPLKELLLIDGRNYSIKIEQCVTFMFYKSFLLALPLFYFNWYCSFTGTALFESMMVFLYPFLFTFLPVVWFGAIGSHESEVVLKSLPALYIDCRVQRLRANNKFIFDAIAKSLIQSGITFYLTVYCVHNSLGRDGKDPDFEIMMLVQYYAIITIASFDSTLLFRASKKKYSIFPALFSLVVLLIYIFINQAAQFVQSTYTDSTIHVFDRAPSVLVMVFSMFASIGASYLIRDHLFVELFETFYEHFRNDFVGNYKKQGRPLNNTAIIDKAEKTVLKKNMEISSIVSNAYVQNETIDSLVHEMLTAADFSSSELGMNPFTLRFQNRKQEERYRRFVIFENLKYVRIIYWVLWFIFAGYLIGEAVINKDARLWIVRVAFMGAFAIIGLIIFTKYMQRQYTLISFLILALVFGFKILNDWLREHDTSLSTGLMALISATNFNIPVVLLVLTNTIHLIDFIVRIIIYYVVDYPLKTNIDASILTMYVVFSLILLLIAVTFTALYIGFNHEKQKRNEFLANTNLEAQQQKNGDILSLLVPKFVKDKLDKGQRTMADDQGERTNIVRILDSIFREFDKICISNGVQKIETVMNTYMACAGLKSCEYNVNKSLLAIDPVRRLLNAAFQMREFIDTVTYGSEGKPIKIKIGINYGRVIAGVIGFHKPQFSLIGDTVNTTSRVCSTGITSRITISDAAYAHVRGGDFHFARRDVPAKGKGTIVTWIVEKTVAKKNKINQKFRAIIMKHKKLIHEMFVAMNASSNINVMQTISDKENITIKSTKDREKLFENIKIDAKAIKDRITQQIALDEKLELQEEDRGSIVKEFVEDHNEEDKIDLGDQLLQPHKLLLTFPKHQKVSKEEFEGYQYDQNKKFRFICNVILFGVFLVQTIVLIAARGDLGKDKAILINRGVFLLILLILLVFRSLIKKSLIITSTLLYLYGFIICVLQFYYSKDLPYGESYAEIELIELVYLYLVITNSGGLSFVGAFGVTVFVTIIWMVTYGLASALTLGNCFFFFVFILFGLIQLWINRNYEIKSYNNLLIRNYKTNEQAGLVSQLLPAHAAEKYFNDPNSKNDILDVFEEVTLLFADVAGFTAYSANVEPAQVVEMVSALFTKFDKKCVKHDLYKVYTIGDCYVAMGFINKDKRNPAREAYNMAQMAFEMVSIIQATRAEIKFDELNMRIGIHTGTLVGGITGTDIVRYDIYGPDVSIANKMESEGVKGFVNVSERTRFWLEKAAPGKYRFEPHTVVESFDRNIHSFLTYENDPGAADGEAQQS